MTGTGSTLEQTVEWAKENVPDFSSLRVLCHESSCGQHWSFRVSGQRKVDGLYQRWIHQRFLVVEREELDAALADWRQKAEKWLQEHDQSDTK